MYRTDLNRERGGVLSSFILLFVGALLGLGLGAILYRTGQQSVMAGTTTERGFLEAKPVVNANSTGTGTAAGGRAAGPVNDQSQSGIVAAVNKVGPAVVNIDVTTSTRGDDDVPNPFRDLLPLPRDRGPQERQGEGSGIIINGQRGLVLTNNHVVRNATRIKVQLKDGRRLTGKVLLTDPFSDVALIQIPGGDLPTAVLGNSKDLPLGSWAIAIGNPLGFQHTVTVGVISAHGRDLPAPNGLPLEDLIQTDAAINPGNSGGALCDIHGNVIGMNTAIIPTAQGIGFSVSAETVKYVVSELLQNGRVIRPWMGLSFATMEEDMAAEAGVKYVPGVFVASVRPGQPAAQAGLQAKDVIVAVEKKPVREADVVREMIRRRKPGDKVNFTVSRGGKMMNFTVTLGRMPSVEELTR